MREFIPCSLSADWREKGGCSFIIYIILMERLNEGFKAPQRSYDWRVGGGLALPHGPLAHSLTHLGCISLWGRWSHPPLDFSLAFSLTQRWWRDQRMDSLPC